MNNSSPPPSRQIRVRPRRAGCPGCRTPPTLRSCWRTSWHSPHVPSSPSNRRSPFTQLQAALPKDTALIDFVEYDHHDPPAGNHGRMVRQFRLLAFVVQRDAAPVCIQLGPTEDIEIAVDAWRQSIADFQAGRPSDTDAAAEHVADLVWRPLRQWVASPRA